MLTIFGGLDKNGYGIWLGHGTQKHFACQDWIDVKSWFFACRYRFRKTKNYFDHHWVSMIKNAWEFLDHETLKSGVSPKWFDELSR